MVPIRYFKYIWGSVLVFFYYGPFRNTLLVHCLYAANMLLQIYLGQHVGGIFCAQNLMNMLPAWYVDAAHYLLYRLSATAC